MPTAQTQSYKLKAALKLRGRTFRAGTILDDLKPKEVEANAAALDLVKLYRVTADAFIGGRQYAINTELQLTEAEAQLHMEKLELVK